MIVGITQFKKNTTNQHITIMHDLHDVRRGVVPPQGLRKSAYQQSAFLQKLLHYYAESKTKTTIYVELQNDLKTILQSWNNPGESATLTWLWHATHAENNQFCQNVHFKNFDCRTETDLLIINFIIPICDQLSIESATWQKNICTVTQEYFSKNTLQPAHANLTIKAYQTLLADRSITVQQIIESSTLSLEIKNVLRQRYYSISDRLSKLITTTLEKGLFQETDHLITCCAVLASQGTICPQVLLLAEASAFADISLIIDIFSDTTSQNIIVQSGFVHTSFLSKLLASDTQHYTLIPDSQGLIYTAPWGQTILNIIPAWLRKTILHFMPQQYAKAWIDIDIEELALNPKNKYLMNTIPEIPVSTLKNIVMR